MTQPLNKQEKVALAVLGGLGAGVLLLGYANLFMHVTRSVDPSQVGPTEKYIANVDLPAVPLDLSSPELKTKDTDTDGLSDFSELAVYKTSPYLDDTDGDKVSDKTEITRGSDPNCPEGKNCLAVDASSKLSTDRPASLQPSPTGAPDGSQVQLTPEFEAQFRQILPPEKVRELLLMEGRLTKEQIDQVDDETLRQLYEETLKNIQKQPNQ